MTINTQYSPNFEPVNKLVRLPNDVWNVLIMGYGGAMLPFSGVNTVLRMPTKQDQM